MDYEGRDESMELQTISHVSKTYGVTTRMLRYYEQIGLLVSLRKDGYSYRVYDSNALERLQQIILLRKLQIPVKKICIILDNPKTAMVIEIFKENIAELDNEISALSVIKTISEKFISEIEKLTTVQLSLDLLNEDSVQDLAQSLSLIQKNVKENYTMVDLDKANEQLNKLTDDNIRIICLPPMTVAASHFVGNDPESGAIKRIKDFIRDTELFKIKPDIRYFGFDNNSVQGDKTVSGYEFWVTVPEGMEIPEPLVKKVFNGGLYACYTSNPGVYDDWVLLNEWAKNSEDFEHEPREPHGMGGIMGGRLEEHVRQFYNGLKNPKSARWSHADIFLPIKEIDK